jgi:hypothetical protein
MHPKLTIRLPRKFIGNIRLYSGQHRSLLTISTPTFLKRHILQSKIIESAPLARHLAGLLSAQTSPDDYHKHLDDKYGRH